MIIRSRRSSGNYPTLRQRDFEAEIVKIVPAGYAQIISVGGNGGLIRRCKAGTLFSPFMRTRLAKVGES